MKYSRACKCKCRNFSSSSDSESSSVHARYQKKEPKKSNSFKKIKNYIINWFIYFIFFLILSFILEIVKKRLGFFFKLEKDRKN
jgi:hypothetical protein